MRLKKEIFLNKKNSRKEEGSEGGRRWGGSIRHISI
jgi:hypothetical protein